MGANVEIPIIATTDKLESGMAKARSTLVGEINPMAAALLGLGEKFDSVGKDAAQASEMVEQNAAALADLRAATQRVSAAQIIATNANREATAAYRSGEISLQEFKAQKLETALAVNILKDQLRAETAEARANALALNGIKGSAGQARFGLQDLGFQISDVATQLAGGGKSAMIFAQQGPQIVQAIQMMSGSAGGFAKFMQGGWGAGIMVGVAVLGALWSKLGDTTDAMDKVKFASSAVGDAQSILANVMDMTTGKINTQSTALIALARAQLAVAEVKARIDKTEQMKTITETIKPQLMVTHGNGQLLGGVGLARAMPLSGLIGKDYLSGKITGDDAVKRLIAQNAAGKMSDDRFAELAPAYANVGVDDANMKIYSDARKGLDGGGLAPYLLKPEKVKTSHAGGGRDPLADSMERFGQQQAQLDASILRLKRQQLTDVTAMAQFDKDAVDAEQRRYDLGIQKQVKDKQITAAQGQQLIAEEEIYASLQKQQIEREATNQKIRDAVEVQTAANDNALEMLRAQENLAVSSTDRRRLALEALALEKANVKAQAEAVLAQQGISDAKRKEAQMVLDNLDKLYGYKEQDAKNQTASPGEAYLKQLRDDAANVNDAFQSIKVEGLKSLNDGIVDAIMGAKSLGDVFKNVADQIIADLLRIAVQKYITAPLANALFGGSGGSSGGNGVLGDGTNMIGAIGSLGNVAKLFGFANGTGGAPSGYAWVGERGPEIVKFRGGEQVIPNDQLRGGGGQTLQIVPSPYFDAIVDERADGRVMRAAPVIVDTSANVTMDRSARRQSRRLA